jgi:hypothetical protein
LVSLVFVDPFFMKIRIFSTLHNKRLSIKFSNRCWSCTYQGKPSNRNKIHFLHQMLLLEINQMDLQSSILCSGWKNDESTFTIFCTQHFSVNLVKRHFVSVELCLFLFY